MSTKQVAATQDRWWPASAAARELQVSRETVRQLIIRGQAKRRVMPYLVGTRIGPGARNWYVSERSLKAYGEFLGKQSEPVQL
jgi:orotate phosphoribosyltransferase-like protein